MALDQLSRKSKTESGKKSATKDTEKSTLYPPRYSKGLNPLDLKGFADRMDKLRSTQAIDPSLKSVLQIYDISAIMLRHKDRWSEIREKCYQILEGTIQKSLGPNDVYLAASETEFYVFATNMDRAKMDSLGIKTAYYVTEKLCGVIPGGRAVKVNTFPFNISSGLQGVTSLSTMLNCVERYLKKLDKQEEDLFQQYESRIQLEYVPCIDLLSNAVTLYQTAALFYDNQGNSKSAYSIIDESVSGVFFARLDYWLAGQIHKVLQDELVEGAARFTIPVHYETLAQKKYRDKLVQQCRNFDQRSNEYIVWEFIGFPLSIPQARVRELMSYVRPFASGAIAKIQAPEIHLAQFEGCDLELVTTDLSSLGDDIDQVGEFLQNFRTGCKELGVKSLVTNIASSEICNFAIRSGINMINSPKLIPKVSKPGKKLKL